MPFTFKLSMRPALMKASQDRWHGTKIYVSRLTFGASGLSSSSALYVAAASGAVLQIELARS